MVPRAALLLLLAAAPLPAALADGGWEMRVSAEGGPHGGAIAGAAVVEVAVLDPAASSVGGPAAEPRVTVAGDRLRMAQGSDGAWYAYFADAAAALAADATAPLPGEGLDFGRLCGPGTAVSVLGIDVSAARGVAVPAEGLGRAGGGPGIADCEGEPGGGPAGNVVRAPPRLGPEAGGQIGLDPRAWPLVQLFDLPRRVEVEYDRPGGGRTAELRYGGAAAAALSLDRGQYPRGAEVILEVRDPRLNVDPTDEDSWTFSGGRAFYMAFDGRGRDAASGGPGLADLSPALPALGFGGGALSVDPGGVLEFRTNGRQLAETATDGESVFGALVTLAETGPGTGVFTSYADGGSTLGVARDAPRGRAGTVEYDGAAASVVSAPSPASLSLGPPPAPGPGRPAPAPPPAAPAPGPAAPALSAWVRASAGAWAAAGPGPGPAPWLDYLAAEGLAAAPAGPPEPGREWRAPEWVRGLAGWWAEGRVSDGELLEAVGYLSGRGIIRA